MGRVTMYHLLLYVCCTHMKCLGVYIVLRRLQIRHGGSVIDRLLIEVYYQVTR